MAAPQDDFSAFRFCLDDFPARDRSDALCEIYGRAILKLELEPKPDTPPVMDFTLRAHADLGIADGLASAMLYRRTPRLIDNDDLILMVARNGGGIVRTRSEEVALLPGHAVMTDNTEVGSFE